MYSTRHVKDILDAIKSVKSRVRQAQEKGDTAMEYRLMGDLYALEVCLVIETGKLIDELDKAA